MLASLVLGGALGSGSSLENSTSLEDVFAVEVLCLLDYVRVLSWQKALVWKKCNTRNCLQLPILQVITRATIPQLIPSFFLRSVQNLVNLSLVVPNDPLK